MSIQFNNILVCCSCFRFQDWETEETEENPYERACHILELIRKNPAKNKNIAQQRQEFASLLEKDISDQLILIRNPEDTMSFEERSKSIQKSLVLLEKYSFNMPEARSSFDKLWRETNLPIYYSVLLHDGRD